MIRQQAMVMQQSAEQKIEESIKLFRDTLRDDVQREIFDRMLKTNNQIVRQRVVINLMNITDF